MCNSDNPMNWLKQPKVFYSVSLYSMCASSGCPSRLSLITVIIQALQGASWLHEQSINLSCMPDVTISDQCYFSLTLD